MKKNSIATTVADFQVILTNELGNSIKKSVLFYIDRQDPCRMVSSYEREMIAEKAWAHVVEKSEKYNATQGAKFSTWAYKVAKNFASDELSKLNNDALHMTGILYEDQNENENDAEVCYHKAFGFVEDCSGRLYWQGALEALNRIVSTYGARDRAFAQMLIEQKSKEEIMDVMQISGGNFDVYKHRILKRMVADLRKAGYSLSV